MPQRANVRTLFNRNCSQSSGEHILLIRIKIFPVCPKLLASTSWPGACLHKGCQFLMTAILI